MVIKLLIKFYTENQTLAVALVSVIGGALLTKLIPTIYEWITTFVIYIGKNIGGRFGYRNIQNKYLNWVVLQNQDLNLPGVIGSGERPKLEQVFISLEFSEENKKSLPNSSVELEQNLNPNRVLLKNLLVFFSNYFTQILRKADLNSKNIPTPSIYKPPFLWNIKKISHRDSIEFIVIYLVLALLFLVIPALYLLNYHTTKILSPFFARIVLAFVPVFLLWLPTSVQIEESKEANVLEDWLLLYIPFIVFPLSLLIYTTYVEVQSSTFHWGTLQSIFIGLILASWLFRVVDRSNFSRNEHQISAIKVGELLRKNNTIAILGKPGSGKSTYAQFIALTLARAKAQDKKFYKYGILRKTFGNSDWFLPLLIPLRKVASFIGESNEKTDSLIIDAFRKKVLPSQLREEFTDSYIKYMLKKKRVLFLLDGLDEVADDKQFNIVVDEVKGLISNFSGNKFMITSRYSGWRGGISSEFIEAEVQDLNPNQIEEFIDGWYQAIEHNRNITGKNLSQREQNFRQEQAAQKASKLKETLGKVENIRNLANNPLLLSMICFVHYNKTLPDERLSLYEDCSRLLLEQWEIEKGLPQDDIPLSFTRKEILMEEIAFAIHSGQISTDSDPKEATSERIIPIIKKVLNRFSLDADQAEILFTKLIERTGIILATEKYKNLYTFSHLTFQEFYTAKYIHKNQIEIFKEISQSKFDENSHLTGWWREVILLYSSMQKNPTKVIKDFYIRKPGTDDFLHRKLQISAQCLSEAIEKTDNNIEKRIILDLLEIHTKKRYQNINSKVYPYVKNYLFQFSRSTSFYQYSLQSSAFQAKEEKKLKEYVLYLINESKSNVTEIKSAALVTLDALLEKYNLNQFISKANYLALIENGHLGLVINIARFFATHPQELRKKDKAGEIVKKITDCFLEEIQEEFYTLHFKTVQRSFAEGAFDVFKEAVFKSEVERIKVAIAEKIFNAFKNLSYTTPEDVSNWRYHKSNLKLTLNGLYSLLISLDGSAQSIEHKKQLFEILKTGDVKQQIIAIDLISNFYGQDNECVHEIIKKLTYSNKEVRLSAIASLRRVNLKEQDLLSIKRVFSNCANHEKIFYNLITKIQILTLGVGSCGVSSAERLQILGSKTLWNKEFDELSRKVTEKSLESELNEWVELLDDLIEILDDSLLEKIIDISLRMKNEVQVQIIETILENHEKISGNIKQKAASVLLSTASKDIRYYSLMLIKQANCKIKVNSPEFQCILNLLHHKSFMKSNLAFEILFQNQLL